MRTPSAPRKTWFAPVLLLLLLSSGIGTGCRPDATADDARFAALLVDLYVLQARATEVGDVLPEHLQDVARAHGTDTAAVRAHLATLTQDPERLQAVYADVLRQINERSRYGFPLEALPADPVAP